MTAHTAKKTDLKRWGKIHKVFAEMAEIDLDDSDEDDYCRFRRLSQWVSYFTNSRHRLPRRADFQKVMLAI